jgi:hypothetical protein
MVLVIVTVPCHGWPPPLNLIFIQYPAGAQGESASRRGRRFNILFSMAFARRGGAPGRTGYNRVALFAHDEPTAMGKKFKTGYESDATQLIRGLLAENPRIADEQRKGRSLWWDKKLDPDQLRRARESRVPQKGYVYQTEE